jgi:hypothetical protein
MDLNNQADRLMYIEEIIGNENRARREEHFKRQEVYNERQASYIIEKLYEEFRQDTVAQMRKITSINLTKRIITERASIYKNAAARMWTETSEDQSQEIENVYSDFRVNEAMKRANRLFKLHGQCTIKVVPKKGKLIPYALSPHQYDVIPDPLDPTEPMAYIISTLDRRMFAKDVGIPSEEQNIGDSQNQKIADVDDYLGNMKFIWWTKEANFVTNSRGAIEGDVVPNPIGELPFIEIASERDHEFWVRAGSDVVDFALDFGKLLSDHFNILRLQGYSQAVINSPKAPDNFNVGPTQILHLKQDMDSPKDPSFQFVTPNPDIRGSIESLEMFIRLFLSSNGISTKTIAAGENGESFSSGLERLLAMLERFEASADDIDHFKWAEDSYYRLFKKWQNASARNDLLEDRYKVRNINSESRVQVTYLEPEMIMTQQEKEESVMRLLEAGLMSRKQALSEIYNVSEQKAEEIIRDIDSSEGLLVNQAQTNEA